MTDLFHVQIMPTFLIWYVASMLITNKFISRFGFKFSILDLKKTFSFFVRPTKRSTIFCLLGKQVQL